MPPFPYTTAQIAFHLGISQDTIRRWRTAKLIPQGHQVHQYAPIEWSEQDLETIRAYQESRKQTEEHEPTGI